MDNIPTWLAIVVSIVVGLVVAIFVQLVMVPWQRKKILGQQKSKKPVTFDVGDGKSYIYICFSFFLIFF
jgi:solute carrier family 20 (sodium-dependent phosphate transporter)